MYLNKFSKLERIYIPNPSKDPVDIEYLYQIVKQNHYSDVVSTLRSIKYGTDEYRKFKQKNLSCVMPHGIFNGIGDSDIESFSGYLFFDIDNDSTILSNDSINKLINEFPICFLQVSAGGRGIHFLIKLNDSTILSNDSFKKIYSYVAFLLISKGYNLDMSVNSISKKLFISSDSNVYLNTNVSLSIDKDDLNSYIEKLNQSSAIITTNILKNKVNSSNDSTLKLIPIIDVLKNIKLKTEYKKSIKGKYIIEDIEYHEIKFPKVIKDGQKRKTYFRIINGLYYLNPNISMSEVYSYLYHINRTFTTKQMENNELIKMVISISNHILTTGEIKIKNRIKRIHFNKELNLSKEEKVSMGGKINAKIRLNKSIEKIKKAKEEIESEGKYASQREVAKRTKLGLATVSRNWDKELFDLSEIETEFNQIKNDIVQFKNRFGELVSIERTVEDKETFKSVLNKVKDDYGDISIDIVEIFLKNLNWDSNKIFYFCDRWSNLQKNKMM